MLQIDHAKKNRVYFWPLEGEYPSLKRRNEAAARALVNEIEAARAAAGDLVIEPANS
jgi:hypothetical protein